MSKEAPRKGQPRDACACVRAYPFLTPVAALSMYAHRFPRYFQVILVSLDAIAAILACDAEHDGLPCVQMVDESGGLDRLEQLQEHENT